MRWLISYLSHEFLGGEDKLMVDDPAWLVLSQAAVGVNLHALLMLDGLVLPSLLAQARRVVEETRGHCLQHNKDQALCGVRGQATRGRAWGFRGQATRG